MEAAGAEWSYEFMFAIMKQCDMRTTGWNIISSCMEEFQVNLIVLLLEYCSLNSDKK